MKLNDCEVQGRMNDSGFCRRSTKSSSVRVQETASMASKSSRASRFHSAAKELLCGHGKRPILRTSSTKENPGQRFWGCVYYEVQDGCDFFRWADPEPGGVQQEVEIARNRRKITKLKTRLKEVEKKLWVVAALCIVGWVGFLFLLLQNQYNLKHPNGMHLGYR